MSETLLNEQLTLAVEKLPPVAAVIRRLLAVLNDPNSDVEDISKLIRGDTVLAGNVLRLANSPEFVRSGGVSSIEEAVQQTGINEITRIASTLSAQQLTAQPMENYRTAPNHLWKHTLGVAVAAETIADRFLANSSAAYVAGLLHTVGMVTFEIAAEDQGEKPRKHTVPIRAWEKENFGMENAEAAGLVLKTWSIPEDIVAAVATRHQVPTPEKIGRLEGVLYLASAMAERVPAGLSVEVGMFPISEQVLEPLGLAESDFDELALDASQKLSRLQATF